MTTENKPSRHIPSQRKGKDTISPSTPGYLLLYRLAKEKGSTIEHVVAESPINDPVKQDIVVDFVYLAQTAPNPLSTEEILATLRRKSLPDYCIVRVKDRKMQEPTH